MAFLYEKDFAAWATRQAELLRQRRLAELDLDHLSEEIEELAARERRALISSLKLMLHHLLKWQYQPEKRSTAWEETIVRERGNVEDALDDMPSLRQLLTPAWIDKAYRRACRDAGRETKLPDDAFPEQCPYMLAEILGDWWP
ncbi:DUF29 domain-containing protein [Gloeobacter morelensis]|uniref:DUF29 domain-containing protein n=1 Tax=Gloeobacter morelensis MG652769 TaxID=2781736 RepID=A0ABY3PIA6_9CYAN|nr:DUF29 domain-containing protein [Gloeobacter morelensis]UFP93391.1 DUF29 domain-containing protein [Gloeobacter morelensis MG652769]